jgi:DNA-3-methyladenine glycosylase II
MKLKTVSERNIAAICIELAKIDPLFAIVFDKYGRPPLWDRPQGFVTLLNIILEQQVSLAPARACFDRLDRHLGGVSPAGLLDLDDATLKTIGFSRQKTAYARHLSEAVLAGGIAFEDLSNLPDSEVKAELIKLKGVGEWTSDIYLLMAMLRPDVMPRGDIALHEAYRRLTGAERRPASDEFVTMAKKWKPYRSVAARLLWHYYLSEKGEK